MNKDKQDISEELLNAFIDDQLTIEDKAEIYESTLNDKELSDKVCQLRKISGLVRLAYEEVPEPGNKDHTNNTRRSGIRGVAASLIAGLAMLMGLVLGWNARTGVDYDTVNHSARAQLVDASGSGVTEIKVLVHLNNNDPERVRNALDEVENLLIHYRKTGQKALVEVIANSSGLDLLRVDVSPFPDRVIRMQNDYRNLKFVACQNTIRRLKLEKGVIAKLIPGTIVIDSGVVQIMRRQHQGWSYIQV